MSVLLEGSLPDGRTLVTGLAAVGERVGVSKGLDSLGSGQVVDWSEEDWSRLFEVCKSFDTLGDVIPDAFFGSDAGSRSPAASARSSISKENDPNSVFDSLTVFASSHPEPVSKSNTEDDYGDPENRILDSLFPFLGD